jgi:hypothetical protein
MPSGFEWTRFLITGSRKQVFHFETGRREPLPTTALHDSGNNRTMGMKYTVAKMARNQKIDRHPRYCVNNPPIMGPSLHVISPASLCQGR